MRLRFSKTAQQDVEERIILHLLLGPYYEMKWNLAVNVYYYNDDQFMREHARSPYYAHLGKEEWAKPEGAKTHFPKLNEFLDSNCLDVVFVERKDPDRILAGMSPHWKRLYEIRRTPKFEAINKKILTDFYFDKDGALIDTFKWPERPADPPEPPKPHIDDAQLKKALFNGAFRWDHTPGGGAIKYDPTTTIRLDWPVTDQYGRDTDQYGRATYSVDYAKIESQTMAQLKEAESASNQQRLEPPTGRYISLGERATDEIMKHEDERVFKMMFDTEMLPKSQALAEIESASMKKMIQESFKVDVGRTFKEYTPVQADGQKLFVIDCTGGGWALPQYTEEKEPELVKEATPEKPT